MVSLELWLMRITLTTLPQPDPLRSYNARLYSNVVRGYSVPPFLLRISDFGEGITTLDKPWI